PRLAIMAASTASTMSFMVRVLNAPFSRQYNEHAKLPDLDDDAARAAAGRAGARRAVHEPRFLAAGPGGTEACAAGIFRRGGRDGRGKRARRAAAALPADPRNG